MLQLAEDQRRRPQQARAVQKVAAILDATAALIGERGIDAVAMRDVARAIEAPLSAIYQYFPNKSAIVAMLYARFTEQTRAETAAVAAGIRSRDDFLDAIERLLDQYYETVRSQPMIADIINAVLADKRLQHLDVEDSRWHAEALVNATLHLVRPDRHDEFRRLAFLFNHLIGGLMRLLLALDEAAARQMLDDYKVTTRNSLMPLLAMPGPEPT